MRKLTLLISFILFTTSFTSSNAQSAEGVLKKLFDLSKSKKYSEAAALIVYDGKNDSRKFKQAFDAGNKRELNSVKRICKKIKALLDISDSYNVGKATEKTEDGIKWTTIDVHFNSGKQKLKTNFGFVTVNKKFLLGDID